MKQKMNYSGLRDLSNDVDNMRHSPALSLFLRKDIINFYSKNALRLQVLDAKIQNLIKVYVKHKEDKPVTKTENNQEVYEFNDEESRVKYIAELTKFMETTIEVEI